MDHAVCPHIASLDRLGLSSIDDSSYWELEEHVESCAACRAELERLVQAGSISTNRISARLPERDQLPEVEGFVIEREVGRGGMGVVFEARQIALDRRVALKIVAGGPMVDVRKRKRWLHEAQAISRVRHSNVVNLYEIGEAGTWLYLVLDFVPGGSLENRLGAPVPPGVAAKILLATADAVEAIHQANLLHLDLKPSNILLDCQPGEPLEQARTKVSDFGLARVREQAARGSMSLAGPRGTPSYMAPEQVRSDVESLAPTADVFALGAVLYRMLTGRLPFEGVTIDHTLANVCNKEPVAPREVCRAIPRDIETICVKCLEKAPGRRYSTAAALAADLRRFLAGEPIEARPLSTAERLWRSARRHPVVSTLCGAAFLAAVIGGLVQLQHHRELNTNYAQLEARDRALRLRLYASEIGNAWRALESGQTKEAANQLGRMTPNPTEGAPEDLRGFEWYYLRRLSDVLNDYRTIPAHTGECGGLAFSPDGKLLATCGAKDRLIRMWDFATGAPLGTLEGHNSDVNSVAFSPDGKWLASASDDRTVRVWNAATHALGRTFRGYPGRIFWVVFSRDGKFLAASGKELDVFVWDLSTGELAARFGCESPLCAMQLTSHEEAIITAHEDGLLRVWSLASIRRSLRSRIQATVVDPQMHSVISDLAASPNGTRLLVAGTDGSIAIIYAVNWHVINLMRAHSQRVNCLAHSPDGRYLASADDAGEVRIWTNDGVPLRVFHLPGEAASSLAFSVSGSLITASESGILRFWNWQLPDQNRLDLSSMGSITKRAFTCPLPEYGLAAVVDPSAIRLLDVSNGVEVFSKARRSEGSPKIAASPGSRLMAVSDGAGTIEIWDVAGRSVVGLLQAANKKLSVVPLAFSRDGKFLASCELSSGENRRIDVWDWRARELITSLAGRVRSTTSLARQVAWSVPVAFSHDGNHLATCGLDPDTNAMIWDARTGRSMTMLEGHAQQVNGIAFSPDDKILATASHDRTVKLWSVQSGKLLATLRQGSSWVQSVAFSPDGRTLVSGDRRGTVTFWHVPTLTEMFRSENVHTGSVDTVVFSENGAVMITGAWLTSQGAQVVPWSAPRAASGSTATTNDSH